MIGSFYVHTRETEDLKNFTQLEISPNIVLVALMENFFNPELSFSSTYLFSGFDSTI